MANDSIFGGNGTGTGNQSALEEEDWRQRRCGVILRRFIANNQHNMLRCGVMPAARMREKVSS